VGPGVVRARLGWRHAAAALAIERVLEADGVDAELARREALEDALRVVPAVVAPDPRVIAAHNEVGAAVVLAHQRVKHGLPRAGVPHRGREACEQYAIPRVVALEQHAIALDA